VRFFGYPCFRFVFTISIWFASAEISCRLHLASVLCSTVASDSNVKVSRPFPHRNLFDVTSPFLCTSGCEIRLFSCALRSLLGNTSEMHQRRGFQVRDDLKCMKNSPCLLLEHQLIFLLLFYIDLSLQVSSRLLLAPIPWSFSGFDRKWGHV
jgi:hypothetical protein